jgi:hypothetical protein
VRCGVLSLSLSLSISTYILFRHHLVSLVVCSVVLTRSQSHSFMVWCSWIASFCSAFPVLVRHHSAIGVCFTGSVLAYLLIDVHFAFFTLFVTVRVGALDVRTCLGLSPVPVFFNFFSDIALVVLGKSKTNLWGPI